jgi:hypothetical protein
MSTGRENNRRQDRAGEARPHWEVVPTVFRSLLSTVEELTLLILPHGGQRTARRNAWRAAADLHVTSGYRWTDSAAVPALPAQASARPAAAAHR